MNSEGNTREGDLKGTEASGSQELGWRRGREAQLHPTAMEKAVVPDGCVVCGPRYGHSF